MSKYRSNQAGLREILASSGVQGLVHQHGDRLATAAGDGYAASYMQGRSRYRGLVAPVTIKARRSNLKHNTLVRVLG